MTEGPFEGAGYSSDEELLGTLDANGVMHGARWGFGRKTAVAAGIAVALGAGGYGIAVAAGGSTAAAGGTAAAGMPVAASSTSPGTAPGCGGVFMRGTSGTLKSESGSTLTVQAPNDSSKTVTVTTTSSTVVDRVAAGKFSDLSNGDQVLVSGSYANSTITAKNVVSGSGLADEGTKGLPSGSSLWSTGVGVASGTVAGKTSTGFTIDTSDGRSVAVTVPSSATVSTVVKISVSALTVGKTVAVTGTPDSNGNIAANRVEELDTTVGALGIPGVPGVPGIGRPGFGGGFPFGGGRVGTPPTGMPTNLPSGLPTKMGMPHGGPFGGFRGHGKAGGPCSGTTTAPAPSAPSTSPSAAAESGVVS